MFINIHTHQAHEGDFEIINLFPEEVGMIVAERYYSVGIHPWDVATADIEIQMRITDAFATHPNVLAVGEIGLDKMKPEFELQKEVFETQFEIAERIGKPIIVHCVKAYSELQEILNRRQTQIPVIVHRFSGNKTIAEQMIRFGCYLSFGHELFNVRSKTRAIYKAIPLNRIFHESDDAEIGIREIYAEGARIRGIKEEELQAQILINYGRCFPGGQMSEK